MATAATLVAMMRSRLQLRRVERLERVIRDEHRRWVASLTDDELEARLRELPPRDTDVDAALAMLSNAELDWLLSTSTTDADMRRRVRWLERRRP